MKMKMMMMVAAAVAAFALAVPAAAHAEESQSKEVLAVLAWARHSAEAGGRCNLADTNATLLATNATLAAQVDDILSASTNVVFYANVKAAAARLPKTWAKFKRELGAEFPMFVRHGETDGGFVPANDDENVEWLLEQMNFVSTESWLASIRTRISGMVLKRARRRMREQGRSIVSKDGVNPIQAWSERISGAFNAPFLEGLQAILDELGVEAKVNTRYFLKGAQLKRIQDELYYGDREFTGHLKCRLLLSLGTEEFNRFVERYNAGE